METSLLVISDLHLGGAPADEAAGKPSFQICSDAGQQRLAQFIAWAAAKKTQDHDVHLVLAGDIVDFLAEADEAGEFSAFNASQADALRKLGAIMERTSPIWQALRNFVRQGCALTLLLGNHDVELCLPDVRRFLLWCLGDGRVSFLYDNEALVVDTVLVEHGNRYDSWNAIAHDTLRRMRSQMSRRFKAPAAIIPPGSDLVMRVMNPIKRRFTFIDLLKPETGAALPLIAALAPDAWSRLGPGMYNLAKAGWRQWQSFDERQQPTDPELIAAQMNAGGGTDEIAAGPEAAYDPSFPDSKLFELADEIAGVDRSGLSEVSAAGDLISSIKLDGLFKALRSWVGGDLRTFAIDKEEDTYAKPAADLAGRGFKVIVNGHTHLAKKVPLPNGAVYLNSGTWADLMRVPKAVLEGDESTGKQALQAFIDDLRNNRLDQWRGPVPTFADIELEDGALRSSTVRFFDDPDNTPEISTDGLAARLDHTS